MPINSMLFLKTSEYNSEVCFFEIDIVNDYDLQLTYISELFKHKLTKLLIEFNKFSN